MVLEYIDWEREGVLVLSLNGRITLGEATRILRELIESAITLGRKQILLNLREVNHIDSVGLGELVACSRRVQQEGGCMKLSNLSTRARALMNLTRLYLLFEIYETEDAAIQSFSAQA